MAQPAHPLGRSGVAHPSGPFAAPLRSRAGSRPYPAPPGELPDGPGSLLEDVRAFVGEHRPRLLRLGLHLLVAALPLLAISAHVFGIAPMNVTAGLVVVPLTLVALLLGVFSPSGEERLVLAGAVWGVLATLVYDAVRLDTVYLLGWWGDFIPTVGTWIVDVDTGSTVVGALVGYLWRYVGDGGGIGVAFFVLVAATGLRRWGERATVAAAVVFAVFPVWTGLVATVALAPRGQQQMFPLTPATVLLSLVGHLVFGLVLGLGCARCRRLEEYWPWTPLLDLRRGADAAVRTAPASGPTRRPRRTGDVAAGGWGPPALVTRDGDDPERTEIRSPAPPRSRGRRGGAASRPGPVDPASGPVRVVDMPARAAGPTSGPVPLAPGTRRGPRSVSAPTPPPRRDPSGPAPAAVPGRPGTGPWSPPARTGADPWFGAGRTRATSSVKAPPGAAGRG